MITAERLRQRLYYDPETGYFTYLVSKSGNVKVGDRAGCPDKDGYINICLEGKLHKAHRLAWLWMKGEWPENQIDHRDGQTGNNRWLNLRQATQSINSQNLHSAKKNSQTGFLGVFRWGNSYIARIRVNGKSLKLGVSSDPRVCAELYIAAKRQYHEGCTI